MKRMTAVAATVIALAAGATAAGSLPRARLNDACRWTEEAPPAGAPVVAPRGHLVEDVAIAEALGIRYPDHVIGHMNTPAWQERHAQCTERMLSAVAGRHALSRAEVEGLRGARPVLVDPLAVFVPLGALLLVVARLVALRVLGGFDPDDWPVAAVVLAILAPLAGGAAVGVGQLLGWTVEMLRTHDGHISYRAFYLPASRYGWVVWGAATALFAAVAARVVWRRRGEPRPARRRGRALA